MKKYLVSRNYAQEIYWRIETIENFFILINGKEGTPGQISVKEFTTNEECIQALDGLIQQKLKEGFKEVFTTDSSENIFTVEQIEKDLIKSFDLFANPVYTGRNPIRSISRIVFTAPGAIVDPASFEFMGYGQGPDGIAFEETGGFDLGPLFTEKEPYEDNPAFIKEFNRACTFITCLLQKNSNCASFKALPKSTPIIFVLSVVDQVSKALGRIHPDGRFEFPPNSGS